MIPCCPECNISMYTCPLIRPCNVIGIRWYGDLVAHGMPQCSASTDVSCLFHPTFSILAKLILFADDHGCSYCGGLGHRITECPKLEAVQQKQAGNIGRKDYLASSAADW